MFSKQFGGKVTKDLIEKYRESDNWRNGRFQNLEPTSLSTSLLKMPGMIYKQLSNRGGRSPATPLPVHPFDQSAFLAPDAQSRFIWYGHSVV